MKYRLIVRAEAEKDIDVAFNWYEDQEIGLGKRFVMEIDANMMILKDRPFSWQCVYKRTRRLVVNGFPYSIFYHVIDDEVIVTACVHDKRDPKVWRSRR